MATTGPIDNSPGLRPYGPKKPGDASEAGGAHQSQRGDKSSHARRAENSSRVNISTHGKEKAEAYQKALDIARNTPDVREDKVERLKALLNAGEYKVDSGKIADGMMREAVMERLATMPSEE